MAREARFRTDWLPPASVRPNNRLHWRRKAKAVAEVRALGFAQGKAWIENGGETLTPPYELTVRFTYARRVDIDNLHAGMKGWLDGLEDAGVLTDDGEIGDVRLTSRKGANDGMAVTIREFRDET